MTMRPSLGREDEGGRRGAVLGSAAAVALPPAGGREKALAGDTLLFGGMVANSRNKGASRFGAPPKHVARSRARARARAVVHPMDARSLAPSPRARTTRLGQQRVVRHRLGDEAGGGGLARGRNPALGAEHALRGCLAHQEGEVDGRAALRTGRGGQLTDEATPIGRRRNERAASRVSGGGEDAARAPLLTACVRFGRGGSGVCGCSALVARTTFEMRYAAREDGGRRRRLPRGWAGARAASARRAALPPEARRAARTAC